MELHVLLINLEEALDKEIPRLHIFLLFLWRLSLGNFICNKIEGIKIAPGAPSISHLFFADDCLLFANVDLHNVNNLLQIIEEIGAASRQMVNFTKSSVFYSANVPPRFCIILTRRLKVPYMNPKEKYLGMPLLIGKSKKKCFTHLLDKVKNRLSVYRSKTMAQCSKSLMINTVTNIIPSYTMSCFQIHKDIINEYSVMHRDFWWGFEDKRGTYITSWKDLNLHKDIGGQGFKDMHILNKALLIRDAWRICSNSDEVWVKCVAAKYFPSTSMEVPLTPRLEAEDNENFVWVSELFLSDGREWNVDLVHYLFDQHTAELILKMRLSAYATDKLI
ncbi:uncharacterized protein LOC113309835 [Papaver somniferum]|uniref:uncharacterized protein LOC113309835 n=1 Tax=Papaver somniferum TaxID=3469 RepID=UPI000E703015|nr:uncharacterized protein LOC113309835 [Papaver somniferum]